MLGTQFKDDGQALDDILEITVVIRLAVPLVLRVGALPELTCQLGCAALPSSADPHAFVQFDTNLRERALPDVVLLELLFDSRAESFRRDLEEVLHSVLRVERVDVGVLPDLIKSVLNVVDQRANLTEVEGV